MRVTRKLALFAALIVALAAGLYLGGHPADLPEPVRDVFVNEDAASQADVIDVIEDNYTRRVSRRRLQNGALRGIVDSLDDRFSHYFTPSQHSVFSQSLEGEFSGVGMTVLQHKRGLLVTGVFKRSPAQRAKIRPGDLITAVNRSSIAGEPSEVSTARIKGKAGTFVTLTVFRGKKRRVVRIKRAAIEVPVVESKLRKVAGTPIGVVRIASFTNGVHADVRARVERLLRRGAKGLVIDLRQNGGGLLGEAVLVSSVFVPDGVIVTTKGRKRPKRVLRATGRAIARDKPLVVLVDRGTASASEIVAAALSERAGAKVVGARTFGKGVFGEVFPLPNGGALDLTLGNYFTPKGRNLAGKGIDPDLAARNDLKTRRDEALERALQVVAGQTRARSTS